MNPFLIEPQPAGMVLNKRTGVWVPLTLSGNEITDATRVAATQGDGVLNPRTNFLLNGGFETNTTGWTAQSGAGEETITRITSDFAPDSGSTACAEIVLLGGTTFGGYITQQAAMVAGQTYTFSIWAKKVSASATVRIRLVQSGATVIGTLTQALTDEWVRYTVSGVCTVGGIGSVGVVQGGGAVPASFRIDSAQHELGSSATPYIATNGSTYARALPLTDGDSSFGIWEATTNLITNGGFETNATGWTASGTNTVARSLDTAKFGLGSLKVTYVDSLTLVARALTLTNAVHYASAWVYIPTDFNGDSVNIVMGGYTSATGTLTGSANMSLRDQWQRITAGPFTPDAGDLVGTFNFSTTGTPTNGRFFYVDGVQVEQQPLPTPYVDTNAGVTAARTAGRVQIPIDLSVMHSAQGWFAVRFRSGWANANEPVGGAGFPRFLEWGNVSEDVRFALSYVESTNSFGYSRVNAGGNETPNTVKTLALDETATVIGMHRPLLPAVSVNGGSFVPGLNANSRRGLMTATTMHIGSDKNASSHIDCIFEWVAWGTGVLSDADAAVIHGYGKRLPTNLAAIPGICVGVWEAQDGFARTRTVSDFNPSMLANMRGWFGADHLLPMGLVDGNTVTTWWDASGFNNAPTNANVANRGVLETSEVNGLPIVRFDTNDILIAPAATLTDDDFTIFVVAKSVAETINNHFVTQHAGTADVGRWTFGADSSNARKLRFFYTDAGNTARSVVSVNEYLTAGAPYRCYVANMTAAQVITLRINGVQDSTASPNVAFTPFNTGFRIGGVGGATAPTTGQLDIAEVLVFQTSLSATDIARVEQHLSKKYKLGF